MNFKRRSQQAAHSQEAARQCDVSGERIMNNKRIRLKSLPLAIAAATALMAASAPAHALSFNWGEVTGNLDTTLSYGASWRVADRDDNLVGKAFFDPLISTRSNAEQRAARGRFSNNSDDGNLNYDEGDLISHAVSITSELDIQWRNFGAFARANYFYDFENQDKEELTELARDEFVGEDFTLLDAYVYGDFEVGERFASVRLGRQVVSWGESTFIQGGINVINPVDVARLRVAGAELRNAFLPIDQIWGTIDLTDNIAIEAVYMFEFEQIDPDPAGTYFSVNDFATPGGQYAMLGFGLFPDDPLPLPGCDVDPVPFECFPAGALPRAPDRFADESGQYGAALRWFLPDFGDTELGFYYLNYHSRLPLISGTAVTNSSTSSGRFFVEYPEDINLFGISFNSTLLDTGWAIQGELSYRDNVPLQIDDVEVLFAGLSPLNAAIPDPGSRFVSQLGNFAPGEEIRGWNRHEVSQLQFTFTRLFGPNNPFGANEFVVVGEIGAQKVWDLPDKDVLRYNGPGTDTGGGPDFLTGDFRNPQTQVDGFADDFSMGYRILTRLDYNSAFGSAFTLSPRLGFNHDVEGTSPGPGGNFVEDRKSVTIGLSANYLQKWVADVSYTAFFDAGQFNLLKDRDFVSASLQYSF